MANSGPSGAAATRDFQRLLVGYLDGTTSIEELLAWEADLSLDARAAGALRASLDRLSLVAAEVCDGVRGEAEFRALALDELAAARSRPELAVAEAPAPYRTGEPAQ